MKNLTYILTALGFLVSMHGCDVICKDQVDKADNAISARDSLQVLVNNLLDDVPTDTLGQQLPKADDAELKYVGDDIKDYQICVEVTTTRRWQVNATFYLIKFGADTVIVHERGLNQVSGVEIYTVKTASSYELHVNNIIYRNPRWRTVSPDFAVDQGDFKISFNKDLFGHGYSPALIGGTDARDAGVVRKSVNIGDLWAASTGDESAKYYVFFNDRSKEHGTLYFATLPADTIWSGLMTSSNLGVANWGCDF